MEDAPALPKGGDLAGREYLELEAVHNALEMLYNDNCTRAQHTKIPTPSMILRMIPCHVGGSLLREHRLIAQSPEAEPLEERNYPGLEGKSRTEAKKAEKKLPELEAWEKRCAAVSQAVQEIEKRPDAPRAIIGLIRERTDFQDMKRFLVKAQIRFTQADKPAYNEQVIAAKERNNLENLRQGYAHAIAEAEEMVEAVRRDQERLEKSARGQEAIPQRDKMPPEELAAAIFRLLISSPQERMDHARAEASRISPDNRQREKMERALEAGMMAEKTQGIADALKALCEARAREIPVQTLTERGIKESTSYAEKREAYEDIRRAVEIAQMTFRERKNTFLEEWNALQTFLEQAEQAVQTAQRFEKSSRKGTVHKALAEFREQTARRISYLSSSERGYIDELMATKEAAFRAADGKLSTDMLSLLSREEKYYFEKGLTDEQIQEEQLQINQIEQALSAMGGGTAPDKEVPQYSFNETLKAFVSNNRDSAAVHYTEACVREALQKGNEVLDIPFPGIALRLDPQGTLLVRINTDVFVPSPAGMTDFTFPNGLDSFTLLGDYALVFHGGYMQKDNHNGSVRIGSQRQDYTFTRRSSDM